MVIRYQNARSRPSPTIMKLPLTTKIGKGLLPELGAGAVVAEPVAKGVRIEVGIMVGVASPVASPITCSPDLAIVNFRDKVTV